METNTKLTVRTPVAEVEAELTRRRIRLMMGGGRPYAMDDHFSDHVYGDIETVADAMRICDELDEECRGTCAKAQQIREWLADPEWTEDALSIRIAIANARRVCCRSHETGSMAIDTTFSA